MRAPKPRPAPLPCGRFAGGAASVCHHRRPQPVVPRWHGVVRGVPLCVHGVRRSGRRWPMQERRPLTDPCPVLGAVLAASARSAATTARASTRPSAACGGTGTRSWCGRRRDVLVDWSRPPPADGLARRARSFGRWTLDGAHLPGHHLCAHVRRQPVRVVAAVVVGNSVRHLRRHHRPVVRRLHAARVRRRVLWPEEEGHHRAPL